MDRLILDKQLEAALETVKTFAKGPATQARSVSLTIPVSGWSNDNMAGYPYYYDIMLEGLTASDWAEVMVAPGSLEPTVSCGLYHSCETLVDKIRFRATKVPSASIEVECRIETRGERISVPLRTSSGEVLLTW